MSSREAGLIIEAARGAVSLAAYERALFEVLGQRVGYDVAMCVRADGPGPFAPGFQERVRRETRPRWGEYGAAFGEVRAAALAARGVAVDRERLGWRRLERTIVYDEVMRPHRGRSSLIAYLHRGGHLTASVVIGRTSQGFADSEKRLLEELVPVLTVCEAAVSTFTASASLAQVDLTPREREILDYLRLGFTNREIALALGTAPRTVRNQLSRLFQKLGASTRAEAVALSLGSRPR